MKRWLDVLVPGLLLAAALMLRVGEGPMIQHVRNLVFDVYQRIAPRNYQPQPVRIIDVDEESLKRFGQWPWPRSLVADLVDRLTQAGAGAIALDIIFAEPDRTSPASLLALWRNRSDLAGLESELARLPDPDAMLAASLGHSNAVTAFALVNQGQQRIPIAKAGFATAGDDPIQFVPHFADAVPALPALEAASAGNGAVNTTPDRDGIIRRIPLIFSLGDQLYPSFAAETLRIAQGAGTYVVKASGSSRELSFGAATGVTQVKIGQFIVPTDAFGQILLYDSDTVPERYVPAWRVLESDFDPNLVAGHIILVGTSVEGLKDTKTTPLNPAMAGVEVHAQILEQILGGQYLARPDWANGAELLYLAVFGLVLIVASRKLKALWPAGIGIAAILAAGYFSWMAFARSGWLLDPIFPSLVAIIVYISGSLIAYLKTETERRHVRRSMSLYLPPAVADHVARNPESLKLGGVMRDLTVMFCDIRGFTTIAERLEPEALTKLINDFLTPMTGIIQKERGTIDKYIGDCIMAFWNAPLDDPEHARNSMRAALAMRATLDQLNAGWREQAEREGREPIAIGMGVGLNTGRCCVGNMGSEQRLAYSALGDAVNIASRLEGLSRVYGVDIVAGEEVATQATEFALIELDQVRVKGRLTPLRIFTALGGAEVRQEAWFQDLAGRHATLIAAYRTQRWAEVTALLAACRAIAGNRLAALYELYERRVSEYAASPPSVDWDGVFVAATKSG